MTEVLDQATADAPAESSSANITTDTIKFKTYGAFDAEGNPVGVDEDGKPTKSKPSTSRETKDNKTWASQEKNGATLLVENDYRWYNLLSMDGVSDLVPDPEQQLYIFQKGLDQLQTAAVNATQIEFDPVTKQFVTNGVTVDLRDAINTPPSRRVLTDEQKLLKTISAIGREKAVAILEALKAQLAAEVA
jgi:hypothetical protein